MAGLPWFKQAADLRRDPRALILGDILGDERGWTYVVEMRMYLADNAPSGCVAGTHAAVALERGSGWRGTKGTLIEALRVSGFLRVGPARDGEGTELEDVDWHREQGAHVAKFQRDSLKPRGNTHKVVSPSRDIGGTVVGPAQTPRGESRELRVEKEASASQEPEPVPARPELKPSEPPAPRKRRPKADKPADPRHGPLARALCDDVGFPFNGGRDAKAVTQLLALADQREVTRGEHASAEVLRRARIGWAWAGFPACKSLGELLSHWGHYERPHGQQGAIATAPKASDPGWVTV